MDLGGGYRVYDRSRIPPNQPVTPRKPIPMRPQLILGGMDLDWAGVSYIEPVGILSDLPYIPGTREVSTGGSSCLTSGADLVEQPREEVNLEEGLGARDRQYQQRGVDPWNQVFSTSDRQDQQRGVDPWNQVLSSTSKRQDQQQRKVDPGNKVTQDQQSGDGNWVPRSSGHMNGVFQSQVNSNGLPEWNALPFGQLLALADAVSEASTSNRSNTFIYGQQEERYGRQNRDFSHYLDTPIQNSQYQSSLTMLLQKQLPMLSNQRGNYSNHLPQGPQGYQSNQRIISNYPPKVPQGNHSNQRIISNHPPQIPQNNQRIVSNFPPQAPQSNGISSNQRNFGNRPTQFPLQRSNSNSNSNSLPQVPQSTVANPYCQPFDLNVSTYVDGASDSNASAFTDAWNCNISFQTSHKRRIEQNHQPSQLENVLDERPQAVTDHIGEPSHKRGIEQNHQPSQLENLLDERPQAVNNHIGERTVIDYHRLPLSKDHNYASLKENSNRLEENGVGVNTPQPKPKRKKIRGRVVLEGRIRKTPSTTVKRPTQNEPKPAKRKYVRKNGTKTPSDLNSSAANEVPGANTSTSTCTNEVPDANTSTSTTFLPSKRTLNFNLKDQEERMTVSHLGDQSGFHSMSSRVDFNTISEAQGEQLRNKDSSGIKSTLHQDPRLDGDNSRAGYAFDLNRTMTQELEDYISRPEKPAPSTPAPMVEGDHRPLKRAHSHTYGAHVMNLIETSEHHRESSYLNSQIQENYKKRRGEKAVAITSPQGCKDLSFPNANIEENLRNRASSSIREHCPTSLALMKTYRMPHVSNGYHPLQGMPSGVNKDIQVPSHRGTTPNKRYKEPIQVGDFASLTAVSNYNSVPTPPKGNPLSGSNQLEIFQKAQSCLEVPQEKRKRVQKYDPQFVTGNPTSSSRNQQWLQENCDAVYSYLYSSPPPQVSNGQLVCANQNRTLDQSVHVRTPGPGRPRKQKALVKRSFKSILKEVEIKLCSLNINEKAENALVPYTGEEKKKKQRAKVDLDPETDRVWKLLMGKGGDDHEGTDASTEKYWEEERRVLRSRTDAFIARMHLIQGDRRFTKWNGSVVDSVVGVFLTQNVSDHLSSSAFMALASHFPVKSRSNDVGYMYEVEEPDVGVLDSIGSEDPPSQQMETREMCSTESLRSIVEVETSDACRESLKGSNVEVVEVETPDTHRDSSKSSGVSSQESSIHIAERTTSIGNSEGEERGALEDSISSQTSVTSSIARKDEVAGSCSDSSSEKDLPTDCQPNSCSPTYTTLLQMAGTPMFQEYCTQRNINLLSQGKINSGPIYSSITELHPTQSPSSPSSECSLRVTANPVALEVDCSQVIRENSRFSSPSAVTETKGDNGSTSNGSVAETATNGPSCQQRVLHSWNNLQQQPDESFTSQSTQHPDPKILDGALTERRDKGKQPASSNMTNPYESTSDYVGNMLLMDQQKPKEKTVAESNMKEQGSSSGNANTTTDSRKSKPKPQKKETTGFDWDSLRKDAYRKFGKKERTAKTRDSIDWEAVRCAPVHEIAHTIKERGMNNMLAERIKGFLNLLVEKHEYVDLEWLRDVPPDLAKEYLLQIRGLGLKSVECVRLLTLEQLAFPVDTNVGRIAVRLGWVPLQPLPEKIEIHLLDQYPVQENIQKYLWPRLCKLDQHTLYELHYQLITFGKVFCTKTSPNCNACPMRAECRHFASAFASKSMKLTAGGTEGSTSRSMKLIAGGTEEKGIVERTVQRTGDRNSGGDQNSSIHTSPMAHHPPGINVRETLSIMGSEPIISIPPESPSPSAAPGSSSIGSEPIISIPPESSPSTAPGSSSIGSEPIISIPPESPSPSAAPGSPSVPNAFTASRSNNSEPIIEMPASPEPEYMKMLDDDMEDFFYDEDPNEIPTINLDMKEFATSLQNYLQQNNMELDAAFQDALVACSPSIPMPPLKNVKRLRTEHRVFELPDHHFLLNGVERRVENEVCPYLLAIWSPGETADSIAPPEKCCTFQPDKDNLCDEKTCSSCNSFREASAQIVRGTLLIPSRTSMRGSFPLNGTYFQINEMFADHETSLIPIEVPRGSIWKLARVTVHFGTSVPSIFKGQTLEEIQNSFWRGYVCVRGFDRVTRAPKPLALRLHCAQSRLMALQKKQEEQQKQQQKK